jgi:hypothetical protein
MGIINFSIPEQEMLWLKGRMKLTTAVEGGSYLGETALNMSKDFWSLLVSQYQFSLYRLLPKQRLKYLSKYSETLEQFNWQNILACALNIEHKWKVLY